MLRDLDRTGSMGRALSHIRAARERLRTAIDIRREFASWEETCVPSYCHRNLLAAAVSWRRLYAAVAMADRLGASGPVLDFGAATGELGRLLTRETAYHYVERDDAPARHLQSGLPHAVRQDIHNAPDQFYGCIFCLDSLEHNDDFALVLETIIGKLRPDGFLILSGPTENRLYRLGRKIAGFSSHYHKTTIVEIEAAAARLMRRVEVATVPHAGLPLFRISCWTRPKAAG